MSLETKVMEALKEAMKSKNEAGLRTLRAIKAGIIIAKTAEGAQGAISEEGELKMLQKLAKQRRESYEVFNTQNRPDLAIKEKEELDIIEQFLPKALSPEEINAELQKIIAQVNASSLADLGKVMGLASKAFAGKADGKIINEAVKTLLSK
jgi:uncharacterized protein YqeY